MKIRSAGAAISGATDERTAWLFDWGDVRGELHSLGGMLGPVHCQLPSGRFVQPFAIAPWDHDPMVELERLPPLLRHLRGEWPCVPFGIPQTRDDLPDRWMRGVDTTLVADDRFVHGFSANHEWSLRERGLQHLDISIDYPQEHPVRSLARRIQRTASATLALKLWVAMRRDSQLPIGLHPVFALPEQTGKARLTIPSATAARTFPVAVEPGISILQPDVVRNNLQRMPAIDGVEHDLCSLPLAIPTEELVLVTLDEGQVSLENRVQGYRITMRWDIDLFPQCLLWISNRGRREYPWNGRFCALGIEPVAAPFDLGQRHGENKCSPLAGGRQRTTVALTAGTLLETSYTISLDEVPEV